MGDIVRQLLAKPIQLSDQVTTVAYEVSSFKQECGELKSKTEKLAELLRQAAKTCSDLFERPTRRIIEETEKVLYKVLSLVLKCRGNIFKRMFTIIRVAAFPVVSSHLENSIEDISWLLRVSAPGGEYLGLPPTVVPKPILFLIWEHIAILHTGSQVGRSHAAAFLGTLANGNYCYGKLIVEEGGVSPLLKLLIEGKTEGQENAVHAISILGREPESVEHMIHWGLCSVFAKILEEGPIKLQVLVAWAVSVLAASYPNCQDIFAKHNLIRLLVDHLAVETLPMIPTSTTNGNSSYGTKASMNEMVVRALYFLAKDNSAICRTIAESRALLCFAVILESGPEAVQYNSVMAVMEITKVAEKDPDLMESAFKPNSLTCKAIVYQMLQIIKKANSELLIPCISTIGNLAKAITDTRMIGPLVRLLGVRNTQVNNVVTEALIALTKYACTENDLHLDHSNAIINADGKERLIQLVDFGSGEVVVQIPTLVLLSYIALHVPHSEKLALANVLGVFNLASKQSSMILDKVVHELARVHE